MKTVSSLYPVPPKYFSRANYRISAGDQVIHLGCSLIHLFTVRHYPRMAERKLHNYLKQHYQLETEDIDQIVFNPSYLILPH